MPGRGGEAVKTDRQLAQLFGRISIYACGIDNAQNMPEDYQRGFRAGVMQGIEAQRKSDIEVAKRLLSEND